MVYEICNNCPKKICELIEKRVFLAHSVPKTIVVDNGKQFISNEFKRLLNDYEVQNIFYNCVYHLQNNPTERQNAVIGNAIRSYIEDNHKHWDKHLDKIAIAIDTAVSAVTGHTPFYLNHGREYISAGSDFKLFDIDKQMNDTQEQQTPKQKSIEFTELDTVYDDICKRILKSYNDNKAYYDKNKIKYSFSVGDKVYRRSFIESDASKNISAKLVKKFILCTVKEKLSDLAYVLTDDESGHTATYHIKDIKNI